MKTKTLATLIMAGALISGGVTAWGSDDGDDGYRNGGYSEQSEYGNRNGYGDRDDNRNGYRDRDDNRSSYGDRDDSRNGSRESAEYGNRNSCDDKDANANCDTSNDNSTDNSNNDQR